MLFFHFLLYFEKNMSGGTAPWRGAALEEMENLKETLAAIGAIPQRLTTPLRAVLQNRVLRLLARTVGTMALSLLLSGARIHEMALPLAVCLTAATGSALQSLAAMLGAVLGYLYFQGMPLGLEYACASVLVFAAVCIVGCVRPPRWCMGLLATLLTALVGLLFLAQARFSPPALFWYFVRLALVYPMTQIFSGALSGRSSDRLWLLSGTLCGCAAVELAAGITLGQVAAVALGVAAAGTAPGLALCAAAGLAVDMAAQTPVSLTALLCAAALVTLWVPLRARPLRALLFFLTVAAGVLLTGAASPELLPAAALGTAAGLLLPASLLPLEGRQQVVSHRLELAAAVLDEIGQSLDDRRRREPAATSLIFDRASDKVCGGCVLWGQCWQQRSSETYHALCAVAQPMLERGAAQRSDFPHSFTDRCCRLDGLIAAINRELDDMVCRRQYDNRLRESRTVLVRQYRFLRDYLLQTAAEERPAREPQLRYRPELAVAGSGKGGHGLSGDRGACFRTPSGLYCVLLCDGMGTGSEAAAESAAAIRTVAGLIRAGVHPAAALETLNGVYILRGDGCFSTVDLLAVSLVTGEGTLYKWGAAPSYLKLGSHAKRIGTAAPPPGLGVGEGHKAAEYGLSLGDGALLVLLSDGAGGEAAAARIAAWGDGDPKALVNTLIGQEAADGEDDRTALAVCLRPGAV